jgi:hypothetical protein
MRPPGDAEEEGRDEKRRADFSSAFVSSDPSS